MVWGGLAFPLVHAQVNSDGDDPDADPTDGVCDTKRNDHAGILPSGICTLRAAIQTNNNKQGTYTITLLTTHIRVTAIQGQLPTILYPTKFQKLTTTLVTLDGAGAGAHVNALTFASDKNEVSGFAIINFDGNAIELDGGGNSKIQGNYVGVTDAGNVPAPNGTGILISGSSSNVVGGDTANARNIISGNKVHGVVISGPGSKVNKVQGNYIGLDTTGTQKLGNGEVGVFVDHSSDTLIGGDGFGESNVISGNGRDGVEIFESTNTKVLGNYIGTNERGDSKLGNAGAGINISNSSRSIVGITGTGAHQIISANVSNGVIISGATSTENTLENNYIGTDVNGTAKFGNNEVGVFVHDAPRNHILGNIISANGKDGIQIQGGHATNNEVKGNYIGTDKDGTTGLGNSRQGVLIIDAPKNSIGGGTTLARNIISSNNESGVGISGSGATENEVLGNYIGTKRDGDARLGNGVNPRPGRIYGGIFIESAPGNTIGGNSPGEGNIISGNNGSGVIVSGSGAAGNKIFGNYIGTDKDGTLDLGNTEAGVFIADAPDNEVGGATPTPGTPPGNIVSANQGANFAAGVHIQGPGATGNKVQGNLIGTQKDGKTGLPNANDGIFIAQSASNNMIGDVDDKQKGNIIAFNGRGGVIVDSGTGNGILSNSIFSNQKLGIDLDTDGVTLNDSSAHTGANHEQNFPVLISAKSTGGEGKLFSTPNTSFTVQIFSNQTLDPSGFGQGEKLEATIKGVTTDAKGVAQFSLPAVPAGRMLAATATDPDNNTSEFSCAPLQKLALGSRLSQGHSACLKIYVPSRWGGKLSVDTPVAVNRDIRYPDGSPFQNGSETGEDKHGWYMLFTDDARNAYPLKNDFVEEGEARTVPWNFWYFPFAKSPVGERNLYGDSGAYKKLDNLVSFLGLGSDSFDWETAWHKGGDSWWGHCWGATIASIALQQPQATRGFTQDELEGLAADFFNEYGAMPLAPPMGAYYPEYTYPLEKPTPAPGEDVDRAVHSFHASLREMLRIQKRPLHMNLRNAAGELYNRNGAYRGGEVWNQGCYKYKSTVTEDPNAQGDEETEKIRQIKHETTFDCNEDFAPVSTGNPKDNPDFRREQRTEYVLMYGDDGDVMPNGTIAGNQQNWLNMVLTHKYPTDVSPPIDLFVPAWVSDVTPAASHFIRDKKAHPSGKRGGGNPHVNGELLITELGLRKNPGF
jgi:hypothetical protein